MIGLKIEIQDVHQCDLLVVGGGIVGLASAYQFTRRFPDYSVTILEKESALAQHQTGRNSGVLHSGIYYRPGSLKAVNCRLGKEAMEAFCTAEGIPFETCGKVIVAVDESELQRLEAIYQRGQANSVPCRMIDAQELHELEPHARGVRAIHVPGTGIVDYSQVCQRLAERVRGRGGEIITGAKATDYRSSADEVTVSTTQGDFRARQVVNCGGLYSDRLARASGAEPEARIVPFRGEYFELKPEAHHLVKSLIYPVPDPSFPFLGVHFTRMINGSVECGPNAVLAFAREGYFKRTVSPSEFWETLTYPGFFHVARKYWRTGLGEMYRSFSKRAFVAALERLVPEIRSEHLIPAPAGVRAQAVMPDGTLVDDFLIQSSERVVNVINAPSPAATASLHIGDMIVDQLAERFAERSVAT